jgi:hypothetical protein
MYFENENKKFMEECNSFDAEINYYTEQVRKIFDTIGIDHDYTTDGIRINVREWLREKKPVFELLRKHPMWNEKAKAIVLLRDEIRSTDTYKFKDDLAKLRLYIDKKISEYGVGYNPIATTALDAISESAAREISEEEAERINKIGYYKEIHSGMKRSRVINNIFKEFPVGDDYKFDATGLVDPHEDGDRNYDSYNKRFAVVADDTNPLKIKRITVLSANICDFLLMSNGNSWSSCHFINSSGAYQGCYKAGTLSYANDGTSMIFYTLPESYAGDEWFMEKKITRQLFFYENGLLLQSRLYPKGGDSTSENYRDYRAVVQDIMSTCLEMPNLWKKVDCDWDELITTHDNSFHYRDYYEFPNECVFTYNKEMESKINLGLYIGGDSYCVDCGDLMDACDDKESELQCIKCCERNYCSRCGCSFYDRDYLHEIDGELYCEDCCFWCEVHEQWEIRYDYRGNDLKRDVYINGESYTMCSDAFDENVVYCERCGDYEWEDEAYFVDDTCMCRNCYEEYMEEKAEEENENEVA